MERFHFMVYIESHHWEKTKLSRAKQKMKTSVLPLTWQEDRSDLNKDGDIISPFFAFIFNKLSQST